MDPAPVSYEPDASGEPTVSSATVPSLAEPSSSVLSDAPPTDGNNQSESQDSLPKPPAEEDTTVPAPFQEPQYSAQTESIIKRVNDNAANAAASGTPGWEVAKDQIMRDMQTSDKFPTPTPPSDSNAPQSVAPPSGAANTGQITFKMEGDGNQVTPTSSGRGRGGGRPRGRGRGGGRGGKRKRAGGSEDESEDSEVYSPVVTTTKSGRSVQKPSSFVPPPPSPTSTSKRKRPYRRNPESAVCKVCLRGTSPANNMIVFCDGCNTPYHRYCHHPPIDQAVVDEIDKEWYCKQCEKERVAPVPESQIANFISAEGAPLEQRQRYFASLSPGMLVTLLTRATTLKPDLPLFAPDFQARIGTGTMVPPPHTTAPAVSHMHAHPQSLPPPHLPMSAAPAPTTFPSGTHSIAQASAGSSGATMNYVHHHPPEQHSYGPDVHPPNYPRPGHGLMRTLPPEQEDLQWLVDEDDRYGVFSHMYQVDPRAANAGMNGGMGHVR